MMLACWGTSHQVNGSGHSVNRCRRAAMSCWSMGNFSTNAHNIGQQVYWEWLNRFYYMLCCCLLSTRKYSVTKKWAARNTLTSNTLACVRISIFLCLSNQVYDSPLRGQLYLNVDSVALIFIFLQFSRHSKSLSVIYVWPSNGRHNRLWSGQHQHQQPYSSSRFQAEKSLEISWLSDKERRIIHTTRLVIGVVPRRTICLFPNCLLLTSSHLTYTHTHGPSI